MKRTTSKIMTAEIPPRSAVFFSKLNARYRLKNGKIYVIIRYRQIGICGGKTMKHKVKVTVLDKKLYPEL